MDLDKRSAWLRKLDEECPYQVVLPRRQLTDDSEILNFLSPTSASSTCTLRTIMRSSCAIASRIRSTPRYFAHGTSRKASDSSSRGERVVNPITNAETAPACAQFVLREQKRDGVWSKGEM